MSRRSQTGIVAGFLMLAVALGFLGVTLNNVSADLDGTKAMLRATANDLVQEEAANAALLTEKAGLEGSLVDANAQNAALTQANAGLANANAILEGNVAEALDAVDDWTAAYETSQRELLESRTAFDELDAEHTALDAQHNTLTRLYDGLDREHQTLTDEHQQLSTQHHRLLLANGTRDHLLEQIAALRVEVGELEARRKPLIVGIVDGVEFACTGSMEPKITCLDTGSWTEPISPDDIVIDAVITYSPDCSGNAYALIAHRVIDIKEENGVYYYWTKGDSNHAPDGCWVPYSNVADYLVGLEKNVRMEYSELRDSVNEARDEFNETRQALSDELVKRSGLTLAEIESRCIPAADFNACFWDAAGLNRLSRSAVLSLNRHITPYFKANWNFTCWFEHAIRVSRNRDLLNITPPCF